MCHPDPRFPGLVGVSFLFLSGRHHSDGGNSDPRKTLRSVAFCCICCISSRDSRPARTTKAGRQALFSNSRLQGREQGAGSGGTPAENDHSGVDRAAGGPWTGRAQFRKHGGAGMVCRNRKNRTGPRPRSTTIRPPSSQNRPQRCGSARRWSGGRGAGSRERPLFGQVLRAAGLGRQSSPPRAPCSGEPFFQVAVYPRPPPQQVSRTEQGAGGALTTAPSEGCATLPGRARRGERCAPHGCEQPKNQSTRRAKKRQNS